MQLKSAGIQYLLRKLALDVGLGAVEKGCRHVQRGAPAAPAYAKPSDESCMPIYGPIGVVGEEEVLKDDAVFFA